MLATHSQIISQLGLAAGETGGWCVPAPAGQAAAGARRQAGAARISLSIPGQELGAGPASPHLTLLVTGVETWRGAALCHCQYCQLSGCGGDSFWSLALVLEIDVYPAMKCETNIYDTP